MEKYLPFFPLNLVVYPGEPLNLHVFEPRYKQLVRDCTTNNTTFGIPAFLNNRISEYGTEVRVVAIERTYPDGRMDIRSEGLQVFRLLTFDNPAPSKLYAGGEVQALARQDEQDDDVHADLVTEIYKLYRLLNLTLEVDPEAEQPFSYAVAHKLGLSLDQEYELLTIEQERERQLFLIEHLRKTLPVVEELERTKARIRQNGHFKHFDPLNF